jgi:hypothetical protein
MPDFIGTVGWDRTTDLRIHNIAVGAYAPDFTAPIPPVLGRIANEKAAVPQPDSQPENSLLFLVCPTPYDSTPRS